MTTYKITFGTGKDAVTMLEITNSIISTLSELRDSGWEIDEISLIEKQ